MPGDRNRITDRNHGNRSQRKYHGDDRRRDVKRRVDVGRSQVFLEKKFHAIRQRLQQPKGPTRVGPQRFCMWPDNLALEPDGVGHRREQDKSASAILTSEMSECTGRYSRASPYNLFTELRAG